MAVQRILPIIFLVYYSGQCMADRPQKICGTSPVKDELNVASLMLNTEGVKGTIILQLVSSQCHTCSLQNVSYMTAEDENCTLTVDTRWPMRVAIISNGTDGVDANCTDGQLDQHFEENGEYIIYVMEGGNGFIRCKGPFSQNKPTDANTSIYVAMGISAGVAIIWVFYKKMYTSRCFKKLQLSISANAVGDPSAFTEQDLGTPTNAVVEKGGTRKERLKSLDTFRGISLVIMMFVNYGGADYWFFQHSKWNGLTVADLVFPWFIWIMGTAMAYSFQSINKKAVSKGTMFLKILKRAIILYLLGLLISSGGAQNPVDFKKIRLMGVLQRFSLTYFITASVHLCFTRSVNSKKQHWWKEIRDLVVYWPEWLVHMVLVGIHCLLTFLLKVPNCPTGYLGPGGLANDGNGEDVSSCTGGAAGYIDRTVLGRSHVYGSPTCKEIYHTKEPYDPEGLLGVLTACFLCFLGLQAGKILIIYSHPRARVIRFSWWAVVLGAFATFLCKASQNDGWIPVNKNLWSLSYVLAMASMAFVLLCVCYITIDVYNIWSGAPFYYPGMNSIVVYVCHEFFSTPFQTFWNIEPTSHAIYMLVNFMDVGFWVLLSLYLHEKQIFISI